jgi:hypothetical protein
MATEFVFSIGCIVADGTPLMSLSYVRPHGFLVVTSLHARKSVPALKAPVKEDNCHSDRRYSNCSYRSFSHNSGQV